MELNRLVFRGRLVSQQGDVYVFTTVFNNQMYDVLIQRDGIVTDVIDSESLNSVILFKERHDEDAAFAVLKAHSFDDLVARLYQELSEMIAKDEATDVVDRSLDYSYLAVRAKLVREMIKPIVRKPRLF